MKKQGFRTWKRGKTWVSVLGVTLIIGNSLIPMIVNADAPKIQASTLQNKEIDDDGSQIIFGAGENLQLKKGDSFTPIDEIIQLKNSDGSINDQSTLKATLDNKGVNLTEKVMLEVGVHRVSYSFTDKDGSTIHRSLTVTVSSQSALNLKSKEITLKIGETFDGKAQVESLINSEGSVNDGSTLKIDERQLDLSKIGNYKVVYSFVDDMGQTISQTLTVNVVSGSAIHLTTPQVTLTCGDSFNAQDYFSNAVNADGVTSVDYNQLQVDSNVDTSKDGSYSVNYSFVDETGQKVEKTLAVDVVDKSNLALTTNEITLTCGDTFNASDYVSSAVNADGKSGVGLAIDSTVNTGIAGDYQVNYHFVNSAGHTLSQSLTVHVVDKASLTLQTSLTSIHAGNNFNPFAYIQSAINSDGKTAVDLSQIKVDHNVNVNQAGVYQANYSFVDSSGNRISQTLYIEIYGQVPIAPVIPPVTPEKPAVKPIKPVIPTTSNQSVSTTEHSVPQVQPQVKTTQKKNNETVAVPTLPSFVDNKGEKKDNSLESSDSFLQSGKKEKQANKDKTKSQSKPTKKSKTMKEAVTLADSNNLKHKKKNNVIQLFLKILGVLVAIVVFIVFIVLKRRNKDEEGSE
jgi:Bacterial Ig-like domain (group 3).